uniref:Uncharacterized protein n=1 Tax=uncultured Fidelibacterota bacterium HF0010_18O13 TaxID=710789 RepID=E0XRA2_9BACT|nr:hypothetical protein [uncultured Marinimicrobia bacterium HF0010_18O13]
MRRKNAKHFYISYLKIYYVEPLSFNPAVRQLGALAPNKLKIYN